MGSLNVLLSYEAAKDMPPKKRLLSLWVQTKLLLCIKRNSFRDAEVFMNEFLHREEGERFHHRTLADYIHAEGKKASALMMEKAKDILKKNNFDPESALPLNPEELSSSVVSPNLLPDEEMIKRIKEAETEYNAKHEEFPIGEVPTEFIPEKSPDDAVYISVDDVLVKHQKDKRNDPEYVKDKKNVANTVIHVQANGRAYVISAIGMANAFIILMAFLLKNNLMENRQLVFLSDGANDIKENIKKFFSWRPYVLILDWFHLAKRMRELSSMCLKGTKEKKQEIIREILHYLWVGDVAGAIAYINSIEDTYIKNDANRKEMAAYLTRKKENICSHALRRVFNLRMSSNTSEKLNHIVVADRQKHNAMSWSNAGSGSLAALATIIRNNNSDKWIRERDISYDLDEAGWEVKSKRAA